MHDAGRQNYLQFRTQANPHFRKHPVTINFASGTVRPSSHHQKVYFSAIGNLHSSHSQHDAYHRSLISCLEQVLWSIKREQSTTCTEQICLPIIVEVMKQIYLVLYRSPAKFQSIMLWAAFCTASFGFL